MEFLLPTLILTAIVAVPIAKPDTILPFILGGVGSLMLFGVVFYSGMPQLIGPFWGFTLTFLVLVAFVFRALVSMWGFDYEPVHVRVSAAIVGMIVLASGVRGCAGSAMFNAAEYRAFAGETLTDAEWRNDIKETDNTHIRVVDRKQAQWYGSKTLGQAEGSLGSRFQIGAYHIQKVGEELVWIAPLEYIGFRSWTKNDATPGYVRVSAERVNDAKLVVGKELRYTESAFFGRNIERHLYMNGYQFKGTTDYTFEVDDEGNPHWVITEYEPTIQYFGDVVKSVLVVDPATGKIESYDPNAAPVWIDRIIPESFAKTRLIDYGRYVGGWLNSWWGEDDVNVPTTGEPGSEDMWLVWSNDGSARWFTGFTSSKTTDDSLVGFAVMDSRTGATRYYSHSGTDESGVISAVNSEVSNFGDYSATQPILYNIYGELTWVVPVISGQGQFQRLALVHAETAVIAIGESKEQALSEYRKKLASSGKSTAPSADGDTKEMKGVVVRVAADTQDGMTTYMIVLENDAQQRIFTGTSVLSPELPLARPGDSVTLTFLETKEAVVPMFTFDLDSFTSRVTEEQMEVDDRKDKRDVKEQAAETRKVLDGLSDDEVLRIQKMLEQNGDRKN